MLTGDERAYIEKMVFALTQCPERPEIDYREGEGLTLTLADGRATIACADKPAYARGCCLLSKALEEGAKALRVTQTPRFRSCGVMLDCSRNSVMRVEAVKRFADAMAALGLNLLMLYTEDTYEVPEQPYLGYLRGRYSRKELREIDDYCASLGIEAVPCIQTLAHMEQFLQWRPNEYLKDQPSCLLADEPDTYRLIEDELRAVRACFRTRRIHIGMDEAHGVGLGRYFAKHGLTDRFELLNRHLGRVVELCKRYDFEPMMWSDMFFRLGSKTNSYYDMNSEIPQSVIERIPDVEMVYWDYYNDDEQLIDHMLSEHERMGKNVVFAGGVWTWSGFLPQVELTQRTMRPLLKQCAKHRVQTVLTTMWGDDCAETDYRLMLNQLPLLSEFCWQGEDASDEDIFSLGAFVSGLPREAYEAFGLFYQDATDLRPGKALIWCDPLYPLLEGIYDLPLCVRRMEKGLSMLAPYRDRPDCLYASLLFELALEKARLILRLRTAYRQDDRAYLALAANEILPRIHALTERLMEAHRALWEDGYKRNGWEVLCLRYGGVAARALDARRELCRYLDGTIDEIAELAEEPLPAARRGGMQFYCTSVTPSYSVWE